MSVGRRHRALCHTLFSAVGAEPRPTFDGPRKSGYSPAFHLGGEAGIREVLRSEYVQTGPVNQASGPSLSEGVLSGDVIRTKDSGLRIEE